MSGPVYVDWAFTSACNLNCRHCVGMKQNDLDRAEAAQVARQIVALAPRWVILEGGEPLLRPDLPELGRTFRTNGVDVFVITNGNAFTPKRLDELKSFQAKVLFSIDGADKPTYEYTKRGARFEVALDWAARCAAAGVFQGLTVVLSRMNLGQIDAFVKMTRDLGGRSLIFLPLKPFGTGAEAVAYYHEYALRPEDHEQAVRRIYAGAGDLDVFYDEPFLWNLAAKYGLATSRGEGGVTITEVPGCAALDSLYIQTDGSVRPCMFCSDELTFGRVPAEPLAAVWRRMTGSATLTGWADQHSRQGACAECPQFAACRGCLARTVRLKADPLAADPDCPLAAGRNTGAERLS